MLTHTQHARRHAAAHGESKPDGASSASVGQREDGSHKRKLPCQSEHNYIANNAKKPKAALQCVSTLSLERDLSTCLELLSLPKPLHIPLIIRRIIAFAFDLLNIAVDVWEAPANFGRRFFAWGLHPAHAESDDERETKNSNRR